LEGCNIFRKNVLSLGHIPTALLVIGYVVFWIELYLFNTASGKTSLLAPGILSLVSIFVLVNNLTKIKLFIKSIKDSFLRQSLFSKVFIVLGCVIASAIIGITFYASLFSPHLIQEYDSLNYHMTLPRQHLILNSFKHIRWSSADLFPLPIDFALAPYWFSTSLPNKFPNYIFFIGLMFVSVSLINSLKCKSLLSKLTIVFSILGLHAFGVQAGTAMLDIILCYLFIAALDSFLNKRYLLALTEVTFLFWSKSFIPIQIVVLLISIFVIYKILIRLKFSLRLVLEDEGGLVRFSMDKKMKARLSMAFVILSLLVGGPFLIKSTYYSGTPLYPFFPGILKINKNIDYESANWKSIELCAKEHMISKDSYGHGRSPVDFIKHFWLISVPEKGVNNSFDYPVGLPYLLFLGPFIFLFMISIKRRHIPLIPLYIVLSWLTWWFGSQQSRFLFISIMLMIIVVLKEVKPTNILLLAVIIAMTFNLLSLYRSHKIDFGKSGFEVLRQKDKELIDLSKKYYSDNVKGPIELDYPDVAFAGFPVSVVKSRPPFILEL